MRKTTNERIFEKIVPLTIFAIIWMGWGHSVYTFGVALAMV